MKVDYKSFVEKYGEVKKYLSKEVIDAVELTLPIWDMYDDAEFKPSIDDVIELVNEEIKDLNNKEEKTKKEVEKKTPKVKKLSDFKYSSHFMNDAQKSIVRPKMEEFEDIIEKVEERLKQIPKLYAQDGKGKKATTYAHYFNSSMDFYVTEFDGDNEVFGYMTGYVVDSEFGYNLLSELKSHFELDFHFKPQELYKVLNEDPEEDEDQEKTSNQNQKIFHHKLKRLRDSNESGYGLYVDQNGKYYKHWEVDDSRKGMFNSLLNNNPDGEQDIPMRTAEYIAYSGDILGVNATWEIIPDKKQKKEKPAKQPKQKFKVGDKVTVVNQNVYKNKDVVFEILHPASFENGEYVYYVTGDGQHYFKESALKKATKSQAKQKKSAKQPKPKFKVGQYVHSDKHGGDFYGVVTAVEYYEPSKTYMYDLQGYLTNGQQWTLNHTDEVEVQKATKKDYDAAFKASVYKSATKVEMIPVEISIIKRYIGMNGKTLKEVKSSKNNNPNTLLNALQKAIVERKIRKESEWKEEIMNIQKSLVKIVNGIEEGLYGNSNVITIGHYDELKKIVDSYVVDNYTTVAKTFISTVQEKSDKKKAENLLKRVENVTTDEAHQDELEAMKKSLKDFVDGKTEKVETTERQLRGLYGSMNGDCGKCVNGLGNVADDNGVIASTDLVKADFDAIGFTGRWASFFGRPSSNFKFMVYGSAGSGKSTFCLQLAKYLSNDLGKKVLYVASEEKFGYTLKEKIERLNVANSNFYIAESIPLDLSSFDVIFFDSVNDLQIEADELEEISKGKATVSIFQCTKDGVYKGGQAFAHNADAVIKVDNMMATSEKNRFGEGGKEFQVI